MAPRFCYFVRNSLSLEHNLWNLRCTRDTTCRLLHSNDPTKAWAIPRDTSTLHDSWL